MLAVIHTIPTAQRQGSQTLICLPAGNESVWWVSDLRVTEHTLQIQFNPWLLVLWRTWENVLLKFNTGSFLLPPMQGQRYAYMTPPMACADGGGGGKKQPRKERERWDNRGGEEGKEKKKKTTTKTILCMTVIFASSAGLAKHRSN